MVDLLKWSSLFFKRNFKKSISVVLSFAAFLFVFDFILGFLLSITQNLNASVVNNQSLYFMEILPKKVQSNTDLIQMKNKIAKTPYVKSAFVDFSHPVQLQNENGANAQVYTVLGVPNASLSYFGVDAPVNDSEFLLIPNTDQNLFPVHSDVSFEEGEALPNDPKGKIVSYHRKVTAVYHFEANDLFPDHLLIIDEKTAEHIAQKMSTGDSATSDRMIAVVPDVNRLKAVESSIEKDFPGTVVHYALKTTKELPQYAVMLIAVSSIIVVILFVISCISLHHSIQTILEMRKRDLTLFYLFGASRRTTFALFVLEFLYYGLLSFAVSSTVFLAVFRIIQACTGFDLITTYWPLYLLVNFVLSVCIFLILSAFQVNRCIRKTVDQTGYKENLK